MCVHEFMTDNRVNRLLNKYKKILCYCKFVQLFNNDISVTFGGRRVWRTVKSLNAAGQLIRSNVPRPAAAISRGNVNDVIIACDSNITSGTRAVAARTSGNPETAAAVGTPGNSVEIRLLSSLFRPLSRSVVSG